MVKVWNVISISKDCVHQNATCLRLIVGAATLSVQYLLVFQKHLVSHRRRQNAELGETQVHSLPRALENLGTVLDGSPYQVNLNLWIGHCCLKEYVTPNLTKFLSSRSSLELKNDLLEHAGYITNSAGLQQEMNLS